MKKHIVAPLLLLSSIALLTSCMSKTDTTIPTVKAPTEAAIPVEVVTTPISTGATMAVSGSVSTQGVIPAATRVLTRTEIVSYKTPAGTDEVEFSVSVTDGVITAASANPKAKNEISIKLQTAFAADVSSKVVGMKAKNLDIDAIGWASLTTGAFETFVRSF